MYNASKQFNPTILILVACLLFLLSACNGNQVDNSIVGTWLLQWPGKPIYWQIKEDGTYTISGPGAELPHEGLFSATNGTWSLKSDTWGDDGGTYELKNQNTLFCIGKLGPGNWVRVTKDIINHVAKTQTTLNTQQDGSRLVAKDLPEFMHSATEQARQWNHDAIPVSIRYQYLKNQRYRGPEIELSFYSPSEGTGYSMKATTQSMTPHIFDQAVNWGEESIPFVFLDLPAAIRIAREHGLKGPLERANLRIWKPNNAEPILAWMLNTGTHGGSKTINGATGEMIDFDVTGYVEAYNAQWAEAAKGLQALFRSSRRRSSSGNSYSNSSGLSDSESSDSQDGGFDYDAYNQKVAEENAYWSGDSNAYNRIKNGNCSWSDSSKYGC